MEEVRRPAEIIFGFNVGGHQPTVGALMDLLEAHAEIAIDPSGGGIKITFKDEHHQRIWDVLSKAVEFTARIELRGASRPAESWELEEAGHLIVREGDQVLLPLDNVARLCRAVNCSNSRLRSFLVRMRESNKFSDFFSDDAFDLTAASKTPLEHEAFKRSVLKVSGLGEDSLRSLIWFVRECQKIGLVPS